MNGVISIIIPVYNHAHTLGGCLDSVVKQQQDLPGVNFEIIIVNDGSTDNFIQVAEQLQKKYTFKLINQENKGAPSARNAGYRESKGELIIFVDADTFCYPKMFKEMCEALEKNPQASYAYSQFRFGWKKMRSREFDRGLLKENNYIDVTSMMRRSDFVFFDESIKRFQDWDLWLSLLEKNKVGIFIKKVLYKKITAGRVGYSSWLPSFMYRLPWKSKKVKEYETAKEILIKKHHLI